MPPRRPLLYEVYQSGSNSLGAERRQKVSRAPIRRLSHERRGFRDFGSRAALPNTACLMPIRRAPVASLW
jgi:hypothetical protein